MINFLKRNYLFLIVFLLIILKEPIYRLFYLEKNIYNPTRCSFLEDDYNKLLEFNNIDYIYESDYYNSVVLYKDIYNYLNEITIRGGTSEGLTKEPVIYDNTLVGVIKSNTKNTSVVQLVTNEDFRVSVKINDSIGVLNGDLEVKNIDNYSDIKVGDRVYTSGLGNIKENIYIGEVKTIELDKKKIEKIVTIKYDLKIKDIDYVQVLKENLWFLFCYL